MGADVRAWPLDQLRRVVATVLQRASLVSGTIRSNLTWRDEAATDEELWVALDMAQASEFVRNKPQGSMPRSRRAVRTSAVANASA